MTLYKLPGVDGALVQFTMGMKTENFSVYAQLSLPCDNQGMLSPKFINSDLSVFNVNLEYCWGQAVWNNSHRQRTKIFHGGSFNHSMDEAWLEVQRAIDVLNRAAKDASSYERRFERALATLVSEQNLKLPD